MFLKSLYSFVFCIILFAGHSQSIFTGNPAICPGTSATLTSPAALGYQWYLDGGTITGATNRVFKAAAPGSYYVVYKTGNGFITSDTVNISLNAKPTANFSVADEYFCKKSPVIFTNTSTAAIRYTWSFNDGASGPDSISMLANPTHKFVGAVNQVSQVFAVKLIATNQFGCSDTVIKNITIVAPDTRLVEAGLTTFNGEQYFTRCVNQSAVFQFSYADPALPNSNYSIDWGDNSAIFSASSLSNINHTYQPGLYRITFTAQNFNCIETAIYNVFVGSNPGGSISNPSSTQGCTGDVFSFPFANINTNQQGTIYVVSVNDGSRADTFVHPPPPFYTHQFNTASCNLGGNKRLVVSYSISNPCGFVEGTIGGIGISQKPTGSFSINPKDTVCIAAPVVITNTSPKLSSLSSNGICTSGKVVWKISPSTGFTVTTGSLGSAINDDVLNWIGGTEQLNVVFNTVGTYTITQKLAGAICGIDSLVKTICVNPRPSAEFTVDKNMGCVPVTVTTTTAENIASCGNYKYAWSVSYVATSGCMPNTAGVSYLQNTSNSSVAPVFRFTSPGVYTISLTVTAPAASCSPAVVKNVVTVKGKPVVTSLGNLQAICVGQTITPMPTVNCNVLTDTSYLWSFSGGLPAVGAIKNPGKITYQTAGTYPVTLQATNGCGDTSVTRNLVVNPFPDLITPVAVAYCQGSDAGPLNFSSSLPNTNITWTNSDPSVGIPAAGTGNIGPFVPINYNDSNLVIKVEAVLNGCKTQSSFPVAIHPKPMPPAVNSPFTLCMGAPLPAIKVLVDEGSTALWYTKATGGTGNTEMPVFTSNSVGTNTQYVSQRSASNCESDRVAVVVNVKPVPMVTISKVVNPAKCGEASGSFQLTGLVTSGQYIARYRKNGGAISNTTRAANTAGIITLNNLAAGSYDSIQLILNGCQSSFAGPIELADPNPPAPPVVTYNGPVCSGTELKLSATPVQTGAATYTWSGPNTFASTLQNPVMMAGVNLSGTYFVTTTVSNCTSTPASVNVLVNQTPATPPLTATNQVCEGETINIKPLGITMPVSYTWTGPGGYTSNADSVEIVNAGVGASGNYALTLLPTTYYCPSLPASINILVKPTPFIASAGFNNPTVCGAQNGTITLNGLAFNRAYFIQYSKDGQPLSTTRLSGNSGIVTINNLPAGNYDNITVQLNGCVSNSVGPFILRDPNAPDMPAILADSSYCSGENLKLTLTTNTTAPYTVVWTGPNGFTSQLASPVIANAQVNRTGVYYARIIKSNCSSTADSIVIVVHQTPVAPALSANSPVCSGDSMLLFSTNVQGLPLEYSWTGPQGFVSNSQLPIIPNTQLQNAGLYNLGISNMGCAAPQQSSIEVKVNETPVIASVIVINPNSCGAFTGSISLHGLLPSTNYQLRYVYNSNVPANVNTFTNPLGILVINNLPSGIYSQIYVTIKGCTSANIAPIEIIEQPLLVPTPSSNSPLCEGGTLRLGALLTQPGAVTFAWSGPAGFTSTLQNPTINAVTAANSGTYIVIASLNGCSATAQTGVLVSPLSLGGFTGNDSTVCAGSNAGTITLVQNTGQVVRWQTSVNSGNSWSNVINTANQLTFNGLSETTLYRAVVKSGACAGAYSSVTQIQVAGQVDAAFAGDDQLLCNATSVNLAAIKPVTGNGRWQQTLGPTAILSNPFAAVTSVLGLQSNEVYGFKWVITGTAGCSTSADEVLVTVRPTVTQANAGKDTTLCGFTGSASIQIKGNLALNRPYEIGEWKVVGSPQQASITISDVRNSSPTVSINQQGIYTLVWSISNDVPLGCSPSVDTLTIIAVNDIVVQADNSGPYCAGNNIQLSANISGGNNYSYNWTGPFGFTATSKDALLANATPANSGQYRLMVMVNGCSAISETAVLVSPVSVGGATGNDTTVCSNGNYGTINVNGFTGSILRWQTSADGGVNWSNVQSTANQYSFTNLKDTTLFRAVVKSGACPVAYSTETRVAVVAAVDAAFAGADQVLCNATLVQLAANEPVVGKGQWKQTLGPPAILPNPLAAVTSVFGLQANQQYGFQWLIADAEGCSSSADEVLVTVRPTVTIANAGNDVSLCSGVSPSTLQLKGNAIGNRFFESGLWSIVKQPVAGSAVVDDPLNNQTTITLTLTGNYQLAWIITNDVGQVCGTSADTMEINVVARPVAGFSLQPLDECTGNTVAVNNNTINANEYRWNWGDGTSSIFTQGSHTYINTGNYIIQLIARKIETFGVCTDTFSVPVKLTDKITAQMKVEPASTCVPYNLRVSAVGALQASRIQWKFFDAATGSQPSLQAGQNASYTYYKAGTDSVRLLVYNNKGCVDSATHVFTVYDVPSISINPPKFTTCNHDTLVVFTGSTASGATINYQWLVDGRVVGATNPFTYRFRTPVNATGTVVYQVQAIGQSGGGCGDTAVNTTVSVMPTPPANINISPAPIQQQPDYTFTFQEASPDTTFKNYRWFTGDRNMQTRTGRSVTYTYSDTGTYLIKLVTTDFRNGCINMDTARVSILYIPGYLQVPNAICVGCTNNELRSFLPLGKGLKTYRLRILTTWGKVVFETTKLNADGSPAEAWNARLDGTAAPQTAYRWQIEARYTNGTEWKGMVYPGQGSPVKSGFITIIK